MIISIFQIEYPTNAPPPLPRRNDRVFQPPPAIITTNRFVIDIDARFEHLFHDVHHFPAPMPFTKFEKYYPSEKRFIVIE